MSLIDLTGSVLVRTRDALTIKAIVGAKVDTNEPGKAWDAPMAIIRHQTTTRSPGAGRASNARISKQSTRFAIRCYGITVEQADQLANAVSELWHECGILEGTNGALIRQAWADVILGPVIDPSLKRPYSTVVMDVLGEAQPMA